MYIIGLNKFYLESFLSLSKPLMYLLLDQAIFIPKVPIFVATGEWNVIQRNGVSKENFLFENG